MINPINLHNEIMSNIFSRLPGAEAMFRQINRTANAANASRAVTQNPADQTAGSTRNAPANNSAVIPFNAILDHFSAGGTSDDLMRQTIENEIELAAVRHSIDPNLIRAVIRVESNYRHDAVSHAGAMGLMQLMPGTAASLGVTDPFDIGQNINGGTMYLRRMLDMFDQDLELALAAYNAGQGNVRRFGGIPPFQETMNHIPRVQHYFEKYTLRQYQRAAEDSRF